MAQLTLNNVTKSFGKVDVIHGIDLAIEKGEFIVFVGPSGCGKSTLLRMIAGLEEISGGDMLLDGVRVNDATPAERGIAMVFQSYALYPHMTVYRNMAFGLKFANASKEDIHARVLRAAEMLQLTPLLDRLPRQLSGGQRQRVAIGRAITREPRLFLFDEPLSNLDAALRVATRIEIAGLKAKMPQTTMIYVTHDQVEAMTLADRIVVLNAGRIEQVGRPLEIYQRPRNLFVAGFMGSPSMNLVPAALLAGDGPTPDGGGAGMRPAIAGAKTFGIRPEDLSFQTEGPVAMTGRLTHVERLGDTSLYYVDTGKGFALTVKVAGSAGPSVGDAVRLGAVQSAWHAFDARGERL